MGLSAYNIAGDAGIICMIALMVVDLLTTLVEFCCSIPRNVRTKFRPRKSEAENGEDQEAGEGENAVKKMIPVRKYRSRRKRSKKNKEEECSICLTEFQANSKISDLDCGHFFHSHCLDKCLKYWYETCPLCRTKMVE